MYKNILIVDDDPIFSIIVKKLVKKQAPQASFFFSKDGQEGLAQLKQLSAQDGEKIVLLDINMPRYNGWYFLDALQESGWFPDSECEIYIVSSSIDEADISKVKEYGFVIRFFHKPLKNNDISTILHS